jgi:plastocyanin
MSAHSSAAKPGNLVRMLRALGAGVVLVVLFGRVQAAELAIVVKDAQGNRLQDAVVLAVALDTPAAGAIGGETSPSAVTIAQFKKQFDPYVSAIRVGMAVNFPNRDDILHNVYSFSNAKTFQLPLYKDKPPEPVIFDKPGVVILGCNIHDWMVAYVYVADTPHFAKTGADGRAVLTGLPPGSYLVRVWHPRKKRRGSSPDRRIRITAASSEPMEFAVALKPEWRPRRPPE